MQTGSYRERVRDLAEDAAFLGIALALSYLEVLIPLNLVIPLPGARIGLANLAVMVVAHRSSMADAAAVSITRVLLSSFLFGNIPSMAFSLSGAAVSLLVLALFRRFRPSCVSWIGISVSCAVAHNVGQLVCAMLTLYSSALLSYLSVLLFLALFFGTLNGVLMNYLSRRIPARGSGKKRIL